MGRRRKRLPHSVQAVVIWFVVSTLSAMGLLYLRATERISDQILQPLAMVLCNGGEKLETTYQWVDRSPRRAFGDPRESSRGQVAALSLAECVGQAGDRRAAPAFLAVVWMAVAGAVGCPVLLAWLGRRVPGRAMPKTR